MFRHDKSLLASQPVLGRVIEGIVKASVVVRHLTGVHHAMFVFKRSSVRTPNVHSFYLFENVTFLIARVNLVFQGALLRDPVVRRLVLCTLFRFKCERFRRAGLRRLLQKRFLCLLWKLNLGLFLQRGYGSSYLFPVRDWLVPERERDLSNVGFRQGIVLPGRGPVISSPS